VARWLTALRLRTIQAWDRLWLRALRAWHPGLEIHPEASSNLACARYNLAPGSRLRIAAGVTTERIPGRLHFVLYPGAEVEIGEGTWLRGGRLRVGPSAFLNGCHLSAKQEVTLGRGASVGLGSRVFDADQHDLDDERPEQRAPVAIGDHVWIAADCTVLKGVTIGEHSVVGTRSLVTRDIPPHTLALGQPARPKGKVGDRTGAR
jgi:hypothetical protein